MCLLTSAACWTHTWMLQCNSCAPLSRRSLPSRSLSPRLRQKWLLPLPHPLGLPSHLPLRPRHRQVGNSAVLLSQQRIHVLAGLGLIHCSKTHTATLVRTCSNSTWRYMVLRLRFDVTGGRKTPLKALAPAKPRVDPGPKPSKKLKAFFWDVLPESRVPGTFWAANRPAYTNIDTQEVHHFPSDVCNAWCPAELLATVWPPCVKVYNALGGLMGVIPH